jgi:hypothetical protein
MDYNTALQIIQTLSDGIDPVTGEVFPADSSYQNAQTVRALFTAIDALESVIKKNNKRKSLPERAGRSWDEAESDLLVQRFDKGATVEELAKEHKRTRGAIVSQLAKLGKVEPTYQRENEV